MHNKPITNMNHKQSGMTLLEVIISLVIIAIAATTFLPLAVFVNQTNHRNQVKMTSISLAEGVMEEIKALPYEERDLTGQLDISKPQIGTLGGSPPGLIHQVQTKTLGAIEYTIETRISWGQDGTNYTAYKKIEVIVSAPDLPGKASRKQADIQSIMSREGEKSVVPGGSLLVRTIRNNIPQKNINISIQPVGGGISVTGYTDETGGVYFAELTAGEYNIDVDAVGANMMPKPKRILGNYPNQSWNSRQTGTIVNFVNDAQPIDVDVDYPVFLNFQLTDADGKSIDKSSFWAEIEPPIAELEGTVKSFNMKITELESLKLWSGWTYDLKLKENQAGVPLYTRSSVASHYSTDPNIICWDGNFLNPSNPTPVNKSLTIKVGQPTISLLDKGDEEYQITITAKPSDALIYFSSTTDSSTPGEPASLYYSDYRHSVDLSPGSTLKIKAQAKQPTLLMDSDIMEYEFTAPL